MARPGRSLRPAVDQMEAKTLLAAGVIGHVAGGHPTVAKSDQAGYFQYIQVNSPYFAATKVTWTCYLGSSFLGSGQIGSLSGQMYTQVESTMSTSQMSAATFTFTFNVPSMNLTNQMVSQAGTSWNGNGQMPIVTQFSLYIPSGQRGGQGQGHEHHHHEHHHHEHPHHKHPHHEHPRHEHRHDLSSPRRA